MDASIHRSKRDTLQISMEGKHYLESCEEQEEISAASGKDRLEITRGKDGNSFIVHFTDSAMVSRAVSRGYITVNGHKIELSGETKKKLTETDKAAEAQRMQVFIKRNMEHDMKVAKQQSATWELYFREQAKALKAQMKLSKGENLTPEELKNLLENDLQGYLMVIAVRQFHNQAQEKMNIWKGFVKQLMMAHRGEILNGKVMIHF